MLYKYPNITIRQCMKHYLGHIKITQGKLCSSFLMYIRGDGKAGVLVRHLTKKNKNWHASQL